MVPFRPFRGLPRQPLNERRRGKPLAATPRTLWQLHSYDRNVSSVTAPISVAFPRPRKAMRYSAATSQLRWRRFPRSSERGPIEATCPPSATAPLDSFPRSSERGPIEAAAGVEDPASELLYFRAHQSAAPLKRAIASATGDGLNHFRAHQSAAPLKHLVRNVKPP